MVVGNWTIGVNYKDIETVTTPVKMSGILTKMEDEFRKIIIVPLFEDSKMQITSLFFDIKNDYEGVISGNGMISGEVFFDEGRLLITDSQLNIREIA